ncbi:hypothetical protein KVR01_012805 [Diaporthe batatas]|uniref:uncharacterized protein n=1 Tax=Diaporthe batatas TaxID=748121 RepID=UPI001D03DD68|nr:uncharacterized protein KVR01_012805 [Diaporthe batatas]KAG8157421.1 hypothetical protein KVR01_012805 [Diaporthe batatas]
MHHHHRPLTLWAKRLPRHTTCQALPPTRQMISLSSSPSHPHRHRQSSLPAAYYRGGTSRAVFFRASDLPADRGGWAAPFLGIIGSPDPSHGRQLDGLGGGVSSLSKVCVVGCPSSAGADVADVDYTFAAVGVRNASVDFSSNCGNMSAAVGPFAVDCGMVRPVAGECEEVVEDVTVRIHNTNTGKIIHATFPVILGSGSKEPEAVAHGDFAIDGVAGTGAPVRLDFIRPAGSRTGKLLPTGGVVDTFDFEAGGPGGGNVSIRATCVDVANPCCFVGAADLGVDGRISPSEMEEDPGLMGTLERVRRLAGVRMGLAEAVGDVPGSVPKIAIVSPCEEEGKGKGESVVARAMSVGQPHKAIPVTVALALAAAAKLPGSVVSECVSGEPGEDGLVIHHASGTLRVDAEYDGDGELEKATVFRTARRLMEGRVFWK